MKIFDETTGVSALKGKKKKRTAAAGKDRAYLEEGPMFFLRTW